LSWGGFSALFAGKLLSVNGGGGQEQWAVRDKGVGNDADFRLDLSPCQNGGLSKFDQRR